MDLLPIIQEKSGMFPKAFQTEGLEAVMLHIKRAEAYWQRAKHESDTLLFTDVIYRTNQAFEGILKEAYSFLTGKEASRLPSHKIEDYLAKSNVFRERVLTAFTHYRTGWRNESAHDYKLFFTEQEALLAINSVSTFCVILLDQMLTKANELHERERSRQFAATVRNRIKGYKSLDTYQKVSALLKNSYEFLDIPVSRSVPESEYIGFLSGFIEAVDPSIKVDSEVLLDANSRERADLIFSRGDEKVVAKIKRYTPAREFTQEAQRQLLTHLKFADTRNGILMFVDEKARKGDSRLLQGTSINSPMITFINPQDSPPNTTLYSTENNPRNFPFAS